MFNFSFRSATDRDSDSAGRVGIERVAQQCLYENCPQIIEKKQWPRNNRVQI